MPVRPHALLVALAVCAATPVQAATAILFHDLQPSKRIWVAPDGSGDGSRERPYGSIQQAVDASQPGTAIMVRAGEYHDTVKFPPSRPTGTPIWLVSADGPGAARIVVSANGPAAAIAGFGVADIVVKDFYVEGGRNGIQFSQKGDKFLKMVSNILVEGNTVRKTAQDGIKIDQADNVQILGNDVRTTGQEGIDFVAVNNALVAYNETSDCYGSAGIMIKAGSTNIVVAFNKVHDIPVRDGIQMGGWSSDPFFVPGFTGYEAKNMTVVGNDVRRVAKRALNVLGAVDSRATGNYFEANPAYDTPVNVAEGSPKARVMAHAANIDISDNIIPNKVRITISPGSNNNIAFHDNRLDGHWEGRTGPAEFRAVADRGMMDVPAATRAASR